jgi:hypothetical protein
MFCETIEDVRMVYEQQRQRGVPVGVVATREPSPATTRTSRLRVVCCGGDGRQQAVAEPVSDVGRQESDELQAGEDLAR